ncbi:site-specific recombinase [Paucibacter oligotrophus]|uniref:Site-specific recombinase n=1 Tax=Roseateles oligotrophus TaxID=1769250 RepID=A0A840LA85_9BURK|nr:site-specific recombinase [Roseateles oligotrophus]MBB4843039.1 site-specific recombinase [Roseateles oligotrophus]
MLIRPAKTWDLTALLNAADPRAQLAARNLWLARLLEWLRHPAEREEKASQTPLPLLRLKHLLNVLDRHPEHAKPIAELLNSIWRDVEAVGLFTDVGFAPRVALWSECLHRLRQHLLPRSADTDDLGELFDLLFPDEADEQWLLAMDEDMIQRLSDLLALGRSALHTTEPKPWTMPMISGLTALVSAVRASGLNGSLRRRMSEELLATKPFEQLASACDALVQALHEQDPAATQQSLQYLRALLEACHRAAASVPEHLEQHGVSVDIMFAVEQLQARIQRIEALLDCLCSEQPQRELQRLLASLVRVDHERRSIRTLFASHYSLLARKVAERSAETGEHYITRDRADYRLMLNHAAGGGAIIAGTTFVKFLVMALGLSALWGGFWAGVNYAASFVIIHLLHWTVATKQPAMTAPAMAQKLEHIETEEGLQSFVDEVANLLRSQMAGILGNLAVVAPLVLGAQVLSQLIFGAPLVGPQQAHYVLHSLTLLGPSLLFAAFTGVLLFSSSLVAGWVENWFVFHRLDAAIAWNPGLIARLGAARAQRWAQWWRANISGMAANVSLGLMLGLVPPVLGFIGIPLDVRHVTLSTGQLAAAAGALGPEVLKMGAFWWCVAGIACTGVLNLGVSFYLAMKVALRSRGIRLADRARVTRAIWQRLREQPRSFFLPPKQSS